MDSSVSMSNNSKSYSKTFKEKKFLGSGSFGKVNKCINKQDGKSYAVKILEKVDEFDIEAIRKQAQAMKRAKSDYTVELLEHFYDDQEKSYVFVMPYFSKGNLTQYISNRKWDKLDIFAFLYQIAEAFIVMNRKINTCWHLDLKPDNILVKSDNQYLICDFGCAKLVDNNSSNSYLLQISQGRGGGTPQYSSPQLIIDYSGGKYSDIWSLGVILYQIIYKDDPIKVTNKSNRFVEMKKFRDGKLQICFPKIEGLEPIIQICKQMLQPVKRLQWDELKKQIYKSLGLSLKTEIVINIERFIQYGHNVSKIVMGLVFYLEKNRKNIIDCDIINEANGLISAAKGYVVLLYKQLIKTIQEADSKPSNNNVFYIFPEIKKNYSIQEKQRLGHLYNAAMNFCQQQYKSNENSSLLNLKLNFQIQVQEFISLMRKNNLIGNKFQIYTQWYKVEQICSFIIRKNYEKNRGLEYVDRDLIAEFAYKIVYE